MLPTIAKLLNKLVKTKLVSYFEKTKYLNPKKYGFMKGESTEDALVKISSNIHVGINQNKNVAGLFIDITEAYDCVVHEIVLNKSHLPGVREVVNRLPRK